MSHSVLGGVPARAVRRLRSPARHRKLNALLRPGAPTQRLEWAYPEQATAGSVWAAQSPDSNSLRKAASARWRPVSVRTTDLALLTGSEISPFS